MPVRPKIVQAVKAGVTDLSYEEIMHVLRYVLTREERPRSSDQFDLTLTDDRWQLLKNFRPRTVATWSLHNRGSQTINYSTMESDPFPSQLAAGDFRSYDTDPDEVYVQRTLSTSSPLVHLAYWFWENRT